MLDDESGRVRTVAWSEICPWLAIFRTFRLAIGPRVLLLAALAIFLTLCGWALFAELFYAEEQTPGWMSPQGGSPWLVIDAAVDDHPSLPGQEDFAKAAETTADGTPGNPFYGTWVQLSRPLWGVFLDPKVELPDLACLVLCGLWALASWAFFGGAITRIAAVQLAADERIGWGAALRFAGSKWLSYVCAPLVPLVGILLAAVPIWVLGWIIRYDVGVLLAALVWPLALLSGLIMAVLLLGLVFGWPLMWTTISTEGKDSFDALQRSYDYVLHRPLQYLFYAAVAAVFGAVGWLLVKNFAAGVVGLTYWAAGWGSGAERIELIMPGGGELTGIGYAGAWLVRFWVGCVKLLAVGFIYSYFWTASAAIYLLLRRDADATEMDEVFLDEDASEQTYGLPPLRTDEAGAPVAADDIPEIQPDEEQMTNDQSQMSNDQ